MKITCPKCNEIIEIPSGHPPKLNISVITLCDILRDTRNIIAIAHKLGCSRAFIYRELKAIGKKPKDYLGVS